MQRNMHRIKFLPKLAPMPMYMIMCNWHPEDDVPFDNSLTRLLGIY